MQKIDENGDGAISFDEWLAFVINKYKGKNTDHNVNLSLLVVIKKMTIFVIWQ